MITVEAIIIEDNLMAWVEGSLDNVIIERYRIKRYGSTIATIKSNDDTLRYQLKEEGIYVVMVTMRYNGELIERYTWPVSYFTETTKKEFDGFLKLDIDNEEELCKTLPLYKMRYPFSYIALVFNKNNKDYFARLKNIDDQLVVENIYQNGRCLTLLTNKGIKNHCLAFSGMAKFKERFIFGIDDFYKGEDYNELKNSLGNFSAIYIKNDSVEIFNDFFGESKFYYYENQDFYIVCNQYHLLLLILNHLNVSLKINWDLVKATLCCNHYMIAQQVFTSKSLVDGIAVLEPYEYIKISDKFEILPTSFKEYVETEPCDMKDKEYRDLLEKAKEEIIENISIVFQNKRIDKVVVDVTGGVDSRMVFAALTNIKDFQTKVTVRTLNIADDLRIAAGIVNAYDLKVDDTPSYTPDFGSVLEEKESCFLGGSYKTYPIKYEKYYEGDATTLRLSGGYGEQMTRYYLTKDFYQDNFCDDECVIEEFLRSISSDTFSYISDYFTGIYELFNFFSRQIAKTPGNNEMEKIEYHYLAFRGAFHFKQFAIVGNLWMPLQSKNLYSLFRKTKRMENIYKLALQVACFFNTPVGQYEYSNMDYNRSLEEIRRDIVLPEEKYRYFSPKLDSSTYKYDAANKAKQEKGKSIPSNLKSGVESDDVYNGFMELMKHEVLMMLRKLSMNNNLQPLTFQLWFYVSRIAMNNDRYIIWLWTRLRAIMHQKQFTEE